MQQRDVLLSFLFHGRCRLFDVLLQLVQPTFQSILLESFRKTNQLFKNNDKSHTVLPFVLCRN
jgi:hypothetical protein